MLSEAECAKRYRQLLAFAADAEQMHHDPNRALGGPGSGSFRRSPLPVGWSTSKPVPVAQGKTTGGTIEPTKVSVLAMQGSGGAAQMWTVCLSGELSDVSPADILAGQFARLTWTAGGRTMSADVDLPGGSACFPITADSIRVDAINETGFPFQLSAFVAPFSHTADWRAPRRTVVVDLTDGAQLVPVPKFAQQVQIAAADVALAATRITMRASSGFSYGTTPFGVAPYLLDLPGNTIELSVPLVAPGPGLEQLTFTFRLGF